MKTLIQNSIKFKSTGKGPNAKTIFSITEESEKSSAKYVNLSKFSGQKTFLEYMWEEGSAGGRAFINLEIPAGLDEDGVKNFIISEINTKLSE